MSTRCSVGFAVILLAFMRTVIVSAPELSAGARAASQQPPLAADRLLHSSFDAVVAEPSAHTITALPLESTATREPSSPVPAVPAVASSAVPAPRVTAVQVVPLPGQRAA